MALTESEELELLLLEKEKSQAVATSNQDVSRDTTSIADLPAPQQPAVQTFGKFVDPFEDVINAMTQEAQENPTVEQRAKLTGVGTTEGAPANVRTAASFGDESSIQKALDKEFGAGVEVRKGPDTGELEFKLQGSDKFELLNSPGLDASDVGSMAGESLVAGADVMGSIFGATVGGGVATSVGGPAATAGGATVGTVIGSTAFTFVGEMTRLAIGKVLGIHDKSASEIANEALIKGGIAGSLTLATFGGIKIFTAVRNALKGRKFSGTAEELGIGANAEADEVIAEINKVADNAFQPRPGQRAGPELREIDELFQRDVNLGQTKAFREIDEANLSVLDEFFAATQKKAAGTGEDQLTSVTKAQKSIEDRFITKNTENIDDVLSANVAKVDEIAAKIDVDDFIPSDAGVVIRGVAEAEQKALKESFSPRYARFSEGEFGQLSNTLNNASPLLRLSKELSKEEQRLLVNGFKNNAELIRPTGKEARTITLQEIQETLKGINALKIKATKGLTSEGADVATLDRVKGALKEERRLLLENNGRTDLYNEVQQLDRDLLIAKDSVDRSIIGDLMRVNQGRFVVKDDTVMKKILRSDVDSQRIFEATKGHNAAREAIRDAMFADYKKSVFKTAADGSESLSVSAHNRFMDNPVFTANVQRFFSDADQKLIGKAGEFAKVMKKQATQAKAMKSRLEKSFGAKVASGDPEAMLQIVFDDKLTGKSSALVKMLRQDPEALNAMRFATKEKIRQTIIRQGTLDKTQFDNIFDSANRVGNLEEIMGKEYVKNLSTLNKALGLLTEKSGLKGSIEPSTSSVVKDLFRAVFAPPLSPKGRVLSAAQSGRKTKLVELIGEAMKDERKLKKLISLTNIPFESKQAVAILTSLGAIELTSVDTEKP